MSARRYWYQLVTPTSDPHLVASYRRFNPTVPFCFHTGCVICSVYTYGYNVFPAPGTVEQLGTNTYNYISNAITACIAQPISGKIFVYVKS